MWTHSRSSVVTCPSVWKTARRWGDDDAAHGVTNLTNASPDDDATYNAQAFVNFVESLGGAPFLAQISFHNCHIPFIGTPVSEQHGILLACLVVCVVLLDGWMVG